MSILLKNGRVLQTPISPLNLSNLKLYLSAQRMYQYSNDTAMPNFIDYSGNNYHATNNTVSEQPLFKLNSFGNAPGMQFDGSNDKMSIPSNNIFQNINQYTVQIACKRTVLSELSVIFGDLIGSTTRFLLSFQANGNIQLTCRRLDLNPTLLFQYPSNDLNQHFIQCTLNPTNYTVSVYHDGILMGNIQLASSGNLDNTPTISYVGYYQTTNNFSTANISEISVSQSYSNPSIIASQYQGWLQRTGLKTSSPLNLQNLKLYLSATRMAQQADESLVPAMYDFSGNNYHATQANTSFQPKFDINQFGNGWLVPNAGISFDGIDDFLSLSGGALDIFRNINQYTVQCAFKRTVLSGTGYLLIVSNNAATGGRGCSLTYDSTNLYVQTRIIDGVAESNITIPSSDTNTHLIQVVLSNATVSTYLDGVLRGSVSVTTGNISNTSSNTMRIGANAVGTILYGSGLVNGISINQSYSDPSIIQAQYQGYLQRGYL